MEERRDRHNNFDGIRLLAAVAVIVGHAWPLSGRSPAPAVGDIAMFHLAVFVFFSLSGYLIATSWSRDSRVWPFLLRRASRIFPALVIVVMVSILIIGPLMTTLSIGEYFASGETWHYLQNLTLAATYQLPGVFTDLPRPVVNGSLWTLGPEFLCYLGVALVGAVSFVIAQTWRNQSRAIVHAIVALGLAVVSLTPALLSDDVRPITEEMVFFAVGASLTVLPASAFSGRWAAAVTLLALVGATVTPIPDIVLAWVALPFVVISVGSWSTPVLRHCGRWGDVSYGMYLWGFPIQQIVLTVAPQLPFALSIVATLVATAALAFGSWHLVEKRALRAGRHRAERHRLRR